MGSPSVEQQRPQKRTIGVLYGFRALMVLLVCNYHIWQLGWLPQYFTVLGMRLDLDFLTRSSYLMVDGMLLMSGLLLYLPYAQQKQEGTPVPSLARFYGNRLTRIVPSYLLSVLVMLLCVALPQGKYSDATAIPKDLLTHFTFTFTFWKETYLHTPLNGALWTVAVEMQFYLIFPFLARAAQRKPAWTLCGMALAGLGYRFWVYTSLTDNAILINQMPGFLDVYALGMLGAMLYVRWQKRQEKHGRNTWQEAAATVVFMVGIYAVGALVRAQSTQSLKGLEILRLSQLMIRLPFALCMLCAMLGAALMPRFLQKLLDNRLMRFLALVSFNLYVWHQPLSALMAQHWFPKTLHSELPLQQAYTVLCLAVSILVAMAATYGVEQPVAKWMNNLMNQRRRKHERSKASTTQQAADPLLLRSESRGASVD